MRILNCKPVTHHGGGRFRDVAIFDVEINDGLRLKGLKLSKAPDGKLFVFSPSSHGLTFAAAGLWSAHYEEHPIEKKWMPAPANWLAGERYDEDLPDVYVDPKEAAIAKAKDHGPRAAKKKPAVADNDDLAMPNFAEWDVGPFSPFGTFEAQIVDSSVDWINEHDQQVVLDLVMHNSASTYDTEKKHTFLIQAAQPAKQERGQQFLRDIMRAIKLEGTLEDTSQLHFKSLQVTIDRGIISYALLKVAA